MNIQLPFQGKIKYPLSSSNSLLGGSGDSLLYAGTKEHMFLEALQIEYEALTHAEALSLVADVSSALTSGNRLVFDGKMYIGEEAFLEESWFLDYVRVKISLREVR